MIGRDQLSVDNSAFEIIDAKFVGNLAGGKNNSRSSELMHSQLDYQRNGTRLEEISGASRIFNTSQETYKLIGAQDRSGNMEIHPETRTEYFNPVLQ